MTLTPAQRKAQAKWQKSNTTMVAIRLQNSTDADIIEFLDGKQKQTIIKAALREYMKNHEEA